MKNIFLILILTLGLFGSNLFAQELLIRNPNEECATDYLHKEMLQNDALYRAKFNEIQHSIDISKTSDVSNRRAPLLTVPIVFHVLHLGEAEGSGTNISQQHIHNALKSLNDAYRGIAPYSTSGVDMEIEFCLASQDPFGNPTDGINRVDATGVSDYATNGITTSGSTNQIAVKALSNWPNTDYYNVWIVSEIDGNNGGSGTQGFAYFPGAPASLDGTVVLHNALGYDPTGSKCLNVKSYTSSNITFIHELGHGFGLYHTFEGDANGTICPINNNCSTNGDRVCDTPPHERSSGCPTGTSNLCGTLRDDHIHNFMDYSSDECQTEFTAGQKTRARTILSANRSSLLSSNGCNPVAVPISEFASECASTSGCLGSAIQFNDISAYNPDSWSWNFVGGTPSTSSDKNPIITYNTPGTYPVTLQATNSLGAGSIEVKAGFITVFETPNITCSPGIQNVGYYGYSFSNVTFGDINNTTSAPINGYNDFSCKMITSLMEGQSYPLSITVGNLGSQTGIYNCFIDFNNDGAFNTGESVLSGSTTGGSGYQTFTQNVTIPLDVVKDTLLRMRVINDQNNLSGPCDNLFTGEAEDYGVIIATVTPAPIELIDFSAQYHEAGHVELKWQTASETNNDYFTMERSTNGVDWEEIFTVDGKGNSSKLSSYSSKDNQPISGISYYRLKQTDFDGEFAYSKIQGVQTQLSDIQSIQIFPNPTQGYITINGSAEELEDVAVYNSLGQNVSLHTQVISKTTSNLVIDLSNLNSGIYFIKTKTTSNKVSKQ